MNEPQEALMVVWNGASTRFGTGRGCLLRGRSETSALAFTTLADCFVGDLSTKALNWARRRHEAREATRQQGGQPARITGLRRCACGCGLMVTVRGGNPRLPVYAPGHDRAHVARMRGAVQPIGVRVARAVEARAS